jgi:hypothetical protein
MRILTGDLHIAVFSKIGCRVWLDSWDKLDARDALEYLLAGNEVLL